MAVFLLLLGLTMGLCLYSGVARAERHDEASRLVFSTFPSDGMGALFTRILTEAYGRLGYMVEVRKYPAERALVMANMGEVDGEAARTSVIEADYTNLIRVPTPIYINRIAVFTRVDGIDPKKGWAQLHGYRLCVRNGYKFVEKMTEGTDCYKVSSYDKMLTLLNNDRVDVGLAEYFDIMPTLSRIPLEGVHMLEQPMASNPMYHYLNKKYADLVPLIDSTLREMVETGWIANVEHEMIHEYFSKSLSPCPMLGRLP